VVLRGWWSDPTRFGVLLVTGGPLSEDMTQGEWIDGVPVADGRHPDPQLGEGGTQRLAGHPLIRGCTGGHFLGQGSHGFERGSGPDEPWSPQFVADANRRDRIRREMAGRVFPIRARRG
jgi:hypothetical protein